MKILIKKIFNSFGFELHRISLENSSQVRLMKMLSMHSIDLVLDVGANVGSYSKALRIYGYKGHLVAFEPLTKVRKELLRLSNNGLMWDIAPQAAVGADDGEVVINIAAGTSASSSILDMMDSHKQAAPRSQYVDTEIVPLRKLDTLTEEYRDKYANIFLKIDTQGYEHFVLEGARKTLERVVGIQLELSLVPLYEGQILYDDLMENMKLLGFNMWELSTVLTDPKSGRLLQVDAVFFRDQE
jgi:FkbM family methyltransferase